MARIKRLWSKYEDVAGLVIFFTWVAVLFYAYYVYWRGIYDAIGQ